MIIRKCSYCGKSKYMSKKRQGVVDRRYRVCYKCQPEICSDEITIHTRSRVLGPDDGDLNYHQETPSRKDFV